MNSLFYDAPIPYILIDETYTIVRANRLAEEYFKFSKAKMSEAKKIIFYIESGKLIKFYSWINNDDFNFEPLELMFRSTVGRSMNTFKVQGNRYSTNQEWIMLSFTDIQNEVELRQELYEKTLAAENANKAKSDFLANMSHEIRTPLNGILGFAQRLAKGETDPARLKEYSAINTSGESLLNIINDILDFSKIESGKMELEYAPILLHNSFKDTTEVFRGVASGKNILFQTIVSENMPECIVSDVTKLKQVVFNLVGNALKFTKEGGHVTLKGSYNDNTSSMRIDVIDDGVGIAKDKQKSIFNAFSQEDTSTTRKYGGTGLGLTISSRIIALMGGELRVESQVGAGSNFYFEIPVQVCSKESIEELTEDLPNDEAKLSGRVLVVEDNKTNQMLLGMILEDNELEYDIANDGAEGVLSYKTKAYDIILMDENMPNMNGIEATEIIREHEKEKDSHIPIIAVTANALVGDREKFLDAGMNDYVKKPYSEEDIVMVLKKYLKSF